ncbi:MAG: hypothetical protein WCT85_04555 [Parachlamydiales bacterium]|jgi:hypothetical protein
MRKRLKIYIIFFVSIVIILGSVFLVQELPKENNIFQKAYIRFRFNIGPHRDYYYRDYYYRDYYYNYGYARVELEVQNEFNKHVNNVQLDGYLIIGDTFKNLSRSKIFSLRPGNHTISWTVSSSFWPGYKTYRKNIRIFRGDNYVYIMIKGDKIYID